MTGTPGVPLVEGWNQIPGARGCTPESIGFRDHYQELAGLGVEVFGLSSQDSGRAGRGSRPGWRCPTGCCRTRGWFWPSGCGCPRSRPAATVRYKRLTLVVREGRIEHVFYPVFPPDRHAGEVVAWLRDHG